MKHKDNETELCETCKQHEEDFKKEMLTIAEQSQQQMYMLCFNFTYHKSEMDDAGKELALTFQGEKIAVTNVESREEDSSPMDLLTAKVLHSYIKVLARSTGNIVGELAPSRRVH